jgi:hypothetical protein
MNLSGALKRKMIYAAIIALLLLPLYRLGQPLTESGGGALAKLRQKHGLAESDLGEIDPASDSMRLATLGMRGVAATLLWKKSDDYRKMQEWDRLSATLDVLALLQPHFEKVWEHQAHNLSYNVSVEFDDYRQRYNWVKKGTEFLMRGVRRNRRAPRLQWYTGWFFGQKMGVADEHVQFRRLFSDDKPFHELVSQQGINVEDADGRGPYNKPDNWLVGRLWMKHAYNLVDNEQVPLLRKNPLHFYQDAALWRSHHGIALEEEGVLDQRAGNAWRLATVDWNDYGQRDIPTYDGYTIRLGDIELFRQRSNELSGKFASLTEGLEDRLRQERLDALTDEEEEALDTPVPDRTQKQALIAAKANARLFVSREDVVRALPAEKQLSVLQLLAELAVVETKSRKIAGYRDQTNFDYWYTRTLAEQEESTLEARQLVYNAEKDLDDADLDAALTKYEKAFRMWRDIFDRYPIMVTDSTADDLSESIQRYKRILDQDKLPDDFPLKAFAELKGETGEFRMSADSYLQQRELEKRDLAEKEKEQEKEKKDSEKETAQPDAKPESAAPTPDKDEEKKEAADVKKEEADAKPAAEAKPDAASEEEKPAADSDSGKEPAEKPE